ncbi:MAG: TetR/AcrR family transcriptional regulator [Solirubrobacterales bacterium]|nr:TetR/AcrR family transcriptional regulator [Solirubrobacterales bacterium]
METPPQTTGAGADGVPARGRNAPPPEVRLPLQRQRLLRAAASEFAEHGYAGSSSESISRRAGMSKATFYEHFANKEECILALFDRAGEVVASGMAEAARGVGRPDARERMRAATRAFLTVLAEHPEFAQTLLVEIIGAGPKAAGRRDQIIQAFADRLDAENAAAAKRGLIERFASPHDAFAVVGAITELVSRHVRLDVPKDPLELAPVIDRLIDGVLSAGLK